jgi:hypothetical protein
MSSRCADSTNTCACGHVSYIGPDRPGEVRTILLLHIISVRPSKQPLMARTFLKVYMDLGSSFLFLQEQIKDIIIRQHKHMRVWARFLHWS